MAVSLGRMALWHFAAAWYGDDDLLAQQRSAEECANATEVVLIYSGRLIKFAVRAREEYALPD